LLLHGSIGAFLLAISWNVSVVPWNLCTAVVGCWILSTAPPFHAQSSLQWAVAAVLLIAPAGFYFGLVDHAFAHVLYSDNVPYGLMTTDDRVKPFARWGSFRVPFPHTRRAFRQYFEITAKPGSKLHIADPRPWLQDCYYLKHSDGEAVAIDRARFLSSSDGQPRGVETDDPHSIFALSQAGARMLKRTDEGMVYAVEIAPTVYRPELLRHLRGLPNIEQLQLAGCRGNWPE
jgi:hypothetical protein